MDSSQTCDLELFYSYSCTLYVISKTLHINKVTGQRIKLIDCISQDWVRNVGTSLFCAVGSIVSIPSRPADKDVSWVTASCLVSHWIHTPVPPPLHLPVTASPAL